MRTLYERYNHFRCASWTLIFLIAILLSGGLWSANADIVLVTARTSSGGITPAPTYSEFGNGTVWVNATAESPGNGAASGSRFISQNGARFTMRPSLAVTGGVYKVEVSHTTTTAGSTLRVTYHVTNCTMQINGTTATNAFDNTVSASVWRNIGTITLDPGVTEPFVTVECTSGAGSNARFYADVMQFTSVCCGGCINVPEVGGVNGPLYAGVDSIEVYGINAGATLVKVYGIVTGAGGHTNLLGATSVNNASKTNVLVSGIVKGETIWATQVINGEESCIKTLGKPAGGGANPRIRVALDVQTPSQGKYFLGASNRVAGFASAPADGLVVTPTGCWQSVSINAATAPWFGWSLTLSTNPPTGSLNLDGLVFAIDDLADSGPYNIYLDDLKTNGVTVADWDAAALGNPNFFMPPDYSGTTAHFLLNSDSGGSIGPNIAQVVDTESYSGSKSLRVSWQFNDTSAASWLHLVHSGNDVEITTNTTISFRMLLLPVTQTRGNNAIATHPWGQTVMLSNAVNLSVTMAHLTNTFSYQWQKNGTNINGATAASYSNSSVSLLDAGSYTVNVTDTACSETITSYPAMLTVLFPAPTIQATSSTGGTNLTLNWAAVTGSSYNLQYKTNLTDAEWITIKTITATNSSISITAPSDRDKQRFYRVQGP